MIFAVKIGRKCVHCEEELEVWFKKDMPNGKLYAAIKHGYLSIEWQEVRGFEDVIRLGDGQ